MYPSQEVSALRKSGDPRAALARGRELLEQHSADRFLKISVGWAIHDLVKQEVERARDNRSAQGALGLNETVERLLEEYTRLEPELPDLLFSRLLFWTLLCPADLQILPKLLAWAGIDAFREEDLRSQRGDDGRVFEPLIERAARQTASVAREQQNTEAQRFALSLIDVALQKADVQGPEWLNYHKALLLDRLGQHEVATTLLVPFVRRKSGEFWAWHALAKVKERSDANLALALYATAVQTCKDSAYGVRVYEDLARVAAAQDRPALAHWAAAEALEIRNRNHWSVPRSLHALLGAPWFATATTLSDPSAELTALAKGASQVIYEDCPRYKASYLGTFISKSGKTMMKVVVRQRERAAELISPAHALGSSDLRVGEPVTVGVLDDGPRSTIFEITRRSAGMPFDCLDEVTGVIDHQNREKALASVYVTPDRFVLLSYQDFPSAAAWTPGTPVRVRCVRSGDRLRSYHAKVGTLPHRPSIRRVEGAITVHAGGFGFVEGVFIPPQIAQTYSDGQHAALVAVVKPHRKTGAPGWVAIGPADVASGESGD